MLFSLVFEGVCIYLSPVSAENVSRLKKLEYLNLALNNIEVIENLEGQYSTPDCFQ